MAEQADHRDQHHHEGQHHRQARQHLQLEVLEVGAQRQAQRGDDGEQHDAEAQLGLAEGEGDQYRGEGAEGLQAAEVAQDQDHQHADRDHDHDLVGLLGLQRQAVERVFEEARIGRGVGLLGQADGVQLAGVEGEADLRLLAAVDLDQFAVTQPPDQAVARQALLAIVGVEVQPVLAIETAQPQLGALGLVGDQADGVDPLQRHVGDGQQQIDHPGAIGDRGVAGQQQLDVVVIEVVDALDGLADEGLDVGRMLADGRQQGLGGDLLGAGDRQALAVDRPFIQGLFRGKALGQHHAVVKSLRAAGAAGGPGHAAVAVDIIDADAVVVGDEALVETDEVLNQRRYEHLHLDRIARVGLEVDLGVDVPDVVGFRLGDRDAENENLVGGDRHAQTHQYGDEDFQVQSEGAHRGYSSECAALEQPGLPAAYLRLGSTRAPKRLRASEPIRSGYWNALRSVRFTSMVRSVLPMQTSSSITGRAV
ncbi:hypothetical protein D3C78_592520 [compost metagenome]